MVFCLLALVMGVTAFASGEASASAEASRESDSKIRIRVIETTDVHGYLMDTSTGDEATFQYRLAYIAQVVNDARADDAYADVLLLDGGDTYQGTPVSNLQFGSALRAAMDAMEYDAIALGNHEFDWGVEEYSADPDGTVPAYAIGDFAGDPDIPILAANLYYAGTDTRVDFTKDYVVVEKAGVLDGTVLSISHAAWDDIGDEMSEVLGYIDTPVDQTRTGDNGASYAGNWITGLMLQATEAQGAVAAFYNSGGIRTSFRLPAGENTRVLTAGDIYTIAPFCNSLFVYDLTGPELAQQLINGFRNGNYGDQMSGLTFEYEASGTGRNADITILRITLADGTEVDLRDETTLYRVCTSNYSGTLAGGVFADKEPVFPASEAPIDNISMIDLLRTEARDNFGRIDVDTSPRGICVNASELTDTSSGEAS